MDQERSTPEAERQPTTDALPAPSVLKEEAKKNAQAAKTGQGKNQSGTDFQTSPASSKNRSILQRIWSWIRKGTPSTDWLIVLLTAVISITSYLQWHEIRSGSTDTHALALAANTQAQKMTDMSAAANEIKDAAQNMVIQDQRIADNAQKAMDASIALAHNEQRAWVIFPHKYALVDFAANGPITYSAGFRNIGRTPADAVQAIVRAEIVASRNEPSLSYEPGTSNIFRSGELVPNDDEPPQKLQARAEHMPIIISSERLRRIQSGGEYVAIYGQVTYKDIAGDHWMRFCVEVNTAEPPKRTTSSTKMRAV